MWIVFMVFIHRFLIQAARNFNKRLRTQRTQCLNGNWYGILLELLVEISKTNRILICQWMKLKLKPVAYAVREMHKELNRIKLSLLWPSFALLYFIILLFLVKALAVLNWIFKSLFVALFTISAVHFPPQARPHIHPLLHIYILIRIEFIFAASAGFCFWSTNATGAVVCFGFLYRAERAEMLLKSHS